MLAPTISHEDFTAELDAYFDGEADALDDAIAGTPNWDRLSQDENYRFHLITELVKLSRTEVGNRETRARLAAQFAADEF